MKVINENELIDSIRNRAIREIRIEQTDTGAYRIIANVDRVSLGSVWKEGDLELINARKKPREWRDLDRLTSHIKKHWGNTPHLVLNLKLKTKEKA